MLYKIEEFFIKRKLKRLIKEANKVIYSGKENINELLQKEFIKNKNGFDLKLSYLAIIVASEFCDYIEIKNVLFVESLYWNIESNNLMNASAKLSSYKAKINIYSIDLMKATAELILAKRRIKHHEAEILYKNSPNSKLGMRYFISSCEKRPITIEEDQNLEETYNKLKNKSISRT